MNVMDAAADSAADLKKAVLELLERGVVSDEEFADFVATLSPLPFEQPPDMVQQDLNDWATGHNLPDQEGRRSFLEKIAEYCHPSLY